ncbi:isoprenyl transferase [Coralliovum pocilloporae]|uniref:isoprenyl transferase n=1 Tax=Coralliovum pocilloporae TaxID=3066369 RepID=UPI0033071198
MSVSSERVVETVDHGRGEQGLDLARMPRHVAIIMDGNGRWATARGLTRTEGHREGVHAVRRTVKAALELGLEALTIFSFSSENWSRPAQEIADLFGLLRLFIKRDLADLNKNNVRIHIVGDQERVPEDIRALLVHAERETRANTGLDLVVAFNYGGRDELVRATRAIARDVKAGLIDPETIDEKVLSDRLDTGGLPEPDLLIRTSGEQRLSNFLLWQLAYAEFIFLDCYWPDFEKDTLISAIKQFQKRDRRFGGLSEPEDQ